MSHEVDALNAHHSIGKDKPPTTLPCLFVALNQHIFLAEVVPDHLQGHHVLLVLGRSKE
jgi:hypothetical protein